MALLPDSTKKLGFGLMRLPVLGGSDEAIDLEQVNQMVDHFLEQGFTYFDTAYPYHMGFSERVVKSALVERHPRESFLLADKLPIFRINAPEDVPATFEEQLEKTGAGYFDFYLLHAMGADRMKTVRECKAWEYLLEEKKRGRIKRLGFSFHDTPEVLDSMLTELPEAEFVQLQINYADWENPNVTARQNYEVARRHGKSIVVMEPVKGGKLADPPEEVKKLFRAYHPDMSYASWAIRFVASLDGILTVLSGMSNVAQMEDNLSYMKAFQPLNAQEQAIIREAQRLLGRSKTIPCTACRYCVAGCPKQIPIPEIFAAMNLHLGNGQMGEAAAAYRAAVSEGHGAANCLHCRKCEQACPQHLPITDYLKQAVELFSRK